MVGTMERFTKCPICGASVRTEYMQSLDSMEVAGAKHLPMSKFDEAEQCFDRTLKLYSKYRPAARNLSMIYEVQENASEDPWYLKESEDYIREGYF